MYRTELTVAPDQGVVYSGSLAAFGDVINRTASSAGRPLTRAKVR